MRSVGSSCNDLREHRDERRVALHVVAVHRRDLAQDREPARVVALRDLLELLAQEIGERVVRRRLPVEALEGVARLLVLRVLTQDAAPLLDRLVRVRPLFRELRDLGHDRVALRPLGQRALRLGEDDREPRALPAGRAPLAEEGEHPLVRRLDLAHLLEPRLGGVGLAAHAPVDHRHLQEGAELLFLAPEGARRQLPLVERHEVLPHLLRGEVVGEEGGRLGVGRREVEQLLVRRGGAIRRLDLLREDARHARQGRDALVLLRRLAGVPVEHLDDLFPAPLAREGALEEGLGAAVLRIEGHRLAQDGDDAIDLAARLPSPVAVGRLGGAHEQRATEPGVAAVAPGLARVPVDQLAPLRFLGRAGRERFARLVAERSAHRHEALVGLARRDVVEHLVVEDAGEAR